MRHSKVHRVKKGVIFDMDGVISDTERIHVEVEREILKKHQISLDEDEMRIRYAGVSDAQMFKEIFDPGGTRAEFIQALIKDKWQAMETASSDRIRAIPHAKELIRYFKSKRLKLAVASASPLAYIRKVLSELELSKYFDVVASSEEVPKGKPAPDIFLLAAERLGLAPADTIVIEDGVPGMMAAQAAGIACIGLVKDTGANYPATILVDSLNEITRDMIDRISAEKESWSSKKRQNRHSRGD